MKQLHQELKRFGEVKTNFSLAKLTTFQIGGPARFLVTVNTIEKTIALLDWLNEQNEPHFILGGGSNLLFPDAGYKGTVVKIIADKILFNKKTRLIEAESGAWLGLVLHIALKNSLSGLEWAVGIPGTVGGAVRGNAGAMGKEIAHNVEKVIVYDNKKILELPAQECGFIYRGSTFKKNGAVVLKAFFKTVAGNTEQIKKEMQNFLSLRMGKFPPCPSAGSFFKNIKLEKWSGETIKLPPLFLERGSVPVGWLIEQTGLKGFAAGGAAVSEQHGNFIINKNHATQSDVLKVFEEVRNKVYNKFGIKLEPEVEIIN